MNPRIVQIVAVQMTGEEGGTLLYGLADDGSVWTAEPNRWQANKWTGPVVEALKPPPPAPEVREEDVELIRDHEASTATGTFVGNCYCRILRVLEHAKGASDDTRRPRVHPVSHYRRGEMRGNDIAFLAEMILKLVPLGDKIVNPDGRQGSERPRFSVEEVRRLADIRDFAPPSSPQTRETTE